MIVDAMPNMPSSVSPQSACKTDISRQHNDQEHSGIPSEFSIICGLQQQASF